MIVDSNFVGCFVRYVLYGEHASVVLTIKFFCFLVCRFRFMHQMIRVFYFFFSSLFLFIVSDFADLATSHG